MNLTEEQQIILNESSNNIYASSSPGSGKSTMLSLIAEKLLKDPTNFILLITFTNKAAKSIIDKCKNVDQARILGGTFHGLANNFTRRNNIHWNICDEGKKRLIIRKVFDCKKDKTRLEEVIDIISKAKSEWPLEQIDEIIKYNNELEKYNLIDFDDMIYKIIELIPNLTLPKITHILTDELQDSNFPQLEMLKTLQKKLNCNMIGVADDDQVLYKWRGARSENVTDFIKIFNCKILNMGINFRSCKNIVEASVRVITHNKKRLPKEIKSFSQEDGVILTYEAKNPMDEIDWVITKCKQNKNEEIAILYRNRLFKNHLEFALRKANIKYSINDSLEISDRSAIKVMISCMKLAAQTGDIYDLEIASKGLKNIGKTTIDTIKKNLKNSKLNEYLLDLFHDPKNHKKYDSLISIISYFNSNKNKNLELLAIFIEKYFIKSFDYQEDMKNFIRDITKEYLINVSDIRDISNDLGLNGENDLGNNDALVQLSTLHSGKGLEWPIVILPWCNQYDQQQGKDYDIESERRLYYVGITRSKKKLYISYSGQKPKFVKEMRV